MALGPKDPESCIQRAYEKYIHQRVVGEKVSLLEIGLFQRKPTTSPLTQRHTPVLPQPVPIKQVPKRPLRHLRRHGTPSPSRSPPPQLRPPPLHLPLHLLQPPIHPPPPSPHFLVLPHVRLHPDPVVRMLPQEREPAPHSLRVAVLDLDEPAARDALEVLLRLLEDEVAAGHGPALGEAREWDGAPGGQAQVVGGAEGEVGEELDVAGGVGAELEGGGGEAVGWGAFEGAEVEGLEGAGEAERGGRILIFLFFRRGGGRGEVLCGCCWWFWRS